MVRDGGLVSISYTFEKANPANLEGRQGDNKKHILRALKDGHEVGVLKWMATTGEIKDLDVVAEAQRQGIATGLYREAQVIALRTRGVKKPRHSADRTDDGDAWAKSLGDRLPRRLLSQ